MTRRVRPAPGLAGTVEPPGDKSISHRAVILNAIAHGESRISNFLPAADTLSTISCLQSLGVQFDGIDLEAGTLTVRGNGIEGLQEPDRVLDAGNSGTTIRLLSGLLAASPFFTVISGDSSLNSRPMERLVRPLRQMGAEIWGRNRGEKAPLSISGGHLSGVEYSMPVASAQLKSALLIAGLFARGNTIIHQPAPSRDHTDRLVRSMGVRVANDNGSLIVHPGPLTSVDVQVPGDISSAAYWLVAGTIHPNAKIRVVRSGVNPSRTGIIDVLRAMGARLLIGQLLVKGGEPTADIQAESSELEGVEIGGDLIPRIIDELPLLALAATQARGKTVIRDAEELRVKESDRIQSTACELSKLGACIEETPDGMIIKGPTPLSGGRCDSHGDHRLAMTLGIAGLISKEPVTIENPDAVNISYPDFWDELDKLRVA